MLNFITLICDLFDAQGSPVAGGKATFTPSAPLADIASQMIITAQPFTVPFAGIVSPQVSLLATDSGDTQPWDWTWRADFTVKGGPAPFDFVLPAGPATFTAQAGSATLTWTPGGALMMIPVGTGVRLSGPDLPPGFSEGITYFVTASSGLEVELATSPGGTSLVAVSAGSGELTVVQVNLSSIASVERAGYARPVRYLTFPAGTPAAGDVVTATGPGSWQWSPAGGGGGGGVQLGGDLGGTLADPLVEKIQGTPVGAPSGSPTQYLDGTGNWSTPAGTGGALSNPMSAPGDTLYGGTAGSPQRLAGNTSTAKKFLAQTGTGTAAGAPEWDAIGSADLPAATTSAPGAIQLGGGTTSFLRGDGTWAAPPTGGGGGAVASVFGRTGAVGAQAGDYAAAQVTGAVQVGGDLGGTPAAPTVAKIQGLAVSPPSGGSTRFLNAAGGWTAPAGGGGSGAVPGMNVIWMDSVGADNTGGTSVTSLFDTQLAGQAGKPCLFVFGVGTYKWGTAPSNLGPGQSVCGLGKNVTSFTWSGAGPLFTATEAAVSGTWNGSDNAGEFRGFSLVGPFSTTNTAGIKYGALQGIRIDDVGFFGLDGSCVIGYQVTAGVDWAEEAILTRLDISGCGATSKKIFDFSTTSFDYSSIDAVVVVEANIDILALTGGALMQGLELGLRGNVHGGATNTGAICRWTGAARRARAWSAQPRSGSAWKATTPRRAAAARWATTCCGWARRAPPASSARAACSTSTTPALRPRASATRTSCRSPSPES